MGKEYLMYDAIRVWPSNCGGMNINKGQYGFDGTNWWGQPPDGGDAVKLSMTDESNTKEPIASSNKKFWVIKDSKWMRITEIAG